MHSNSYIGTTVRRVDTADTNELHVDPREASSQLSTICTIMKTVILKPPLPHHGKLNLGLRVKKSSYSINKHRKLQYWAVSFSIWVSSLVISLMQKSVQFLKRRQFFEASSVVPMEGQLWAAGQEIIITHQYTHYPIVLGHFLLNLGRRPCCFP